MEPTISLTYISVFSRSLSNREIKQIEVTSEKNNSEKDITGMLLVLDNLFFQIIEGKRNNVNKLFDIICQDKRHHNIVTISVDENIEKRTFFAWNMKILSFNSGMNTLIRQPLNFFFYTLLDQLRHRCFLEKMVLHSLSKSIDQLLQNSFEECCALTKAENAGLFVWTEAEESYISYEIIGCSDDDVAPQSLEEYMASITSVAEPLFTTVLSIQSEKRVLALYVLQKKVTFSEDRIKQCQEICSKAAEVYEISQRSESIAVQYEKLSKIDKNVYRRNQIFDIEEILSQFIGQMHTFVKNYDFVKENITQNEIEEIRQKVGSLVENSNTKIPQESEV